MEELQKIVQQMGIMEMIYWATAVVATVVFVIQTLMLFVGFDADADFSGGDADFDADGISLVSVKTISCFLLGFGWTGAILTRAVDNAALVAGIAIAVGFAFMLIIVFLLKQVLRLSRDNSFSTKYVVDSIAEVYLRIPGGDEPGKIIVSYEGSAHELLAFSDSPIATGAKVNVTKAIDESSVYVTNLKES